MKDLSLGVACLVVACAPSSPGVEAPRSDPGLASIGFDGPFTSEAELCRRTIDTLLAGARANLDDPPRCVTDSPSFEAPAPTLPSGHDRITASEPWRTVHVVRVIAGIEFSDANQCLLVIETTQGWFASSRIVEHCEIEGSGLHPIGGFQVVDLIGDSTPELLVETGEYHTPACGTCKIEGSTSRAVCGIDRRGAPRCIPPIVTIIIDDNGTRQRSWKVDRDGWLVVGQFPSYDVDGHAVAHSTTVRWAIDLGR